MRPHQAWQRPGGGRPLFRAIGPGDRFMELPCGRCIGCFMAKGLMWKTRILHESQCWSSSLMVTLQYRDDALPSSLSLEYSHFQLFMKRLRARLAGEEVSADGRRPIRFFVAGEYGGVTHRPHWHAVLFNLKLDDARWWPRRRKGKDLLVGHSELMEDLWSHGYVELAPVNPATASYVAGYVNKKARRRAVDVVDRSTGEVYERRPEFQKSSNDPGLGSFWYDRFGADLWRVDGAVVDGKARQVPRYYNEKLRKSDPDAYERIRLARVARAHERPEESLQERAVREEAALLALDWKGGRGL